MSSKQRLLDLINGANFPTIPLTDSNVTLQNLQPAAGGAQWNTSVDIVAKPGQGYSGQRTVFYRRLSLSVLASLVFTEAQVAGDPQTLLDLINTATGADLALDDVQTFVVPAAPAGGSAGCVLTARPSSYRWIEEVTIQIQGAALPSQTLLLQDTFTDVDGTLLQNHAGEIAALWTWDSSFGSDNTLVEVVGGSARIKASAAYRDEQYNLSGTLPADQNWTLEAGFRVIAGDYNFIDIRLGGNFSTPLIDFSVENSQNASQVTFYGSIRSPLQAFPLGVEQVVKVVRVGDTLTYFLNDTQLGSFTDAVKAAATTLHAEFAAGTDAAPSVEMTYLKAYQ